MDTGIELSWMALGGLASWKRVEIVTIWLRGGYGLGIAKHLDLFNGFVISYQ